MPLYSGWPYDMMQEDSATDTIFPWIHTQTILLHGFIVKQT